MGRGIFRVAVFVIALEIFFRAGGFFSEQWKGYLRRVELGQQAHVRILCLGDSITAAGNVDAYPAQLEGILNQGRPGTIYRVFNLARAGQNSSYSANNIENWIKDYQPDYVVMMLGAMDQTEKNSRSEPLVLTWIKSLRVIQTLDVLKEKAASQVSSFVSEGPQQAKTEMEYIKEEVDKLPKDKKAVSQLAFYADAMGRWTEARKLYYVILQYEELKNVHSFIRTSLANLLWKQKDYAAYVEELKNIPYYSWQGEAYEQLCPQPKFQQEILMAIRAHQAKHPDKPYYEEMLAACYEAGGEKNLADQHRQKAREMRRCQINLFAQQNYKKILEVLDQHPDIFPILVQYPMRELEQLKVLVRGGPGYGRFIFVDNEQNFKDALHRFSYADLFLDRAAGDFGHGTELGNRLMAESIADAILGNGYLRNP